MANKNALNFISKNSFLKESYSSTLRNSLVKEGLRKVSNLERHNANCEDLEMIYQCLIILYTQTFIQENY